MMTTMRLAFALVAVFCLLFQQVAVAAAPCNPVEMTSALQASAHHCDEMPLAKTLPSLCKGHCSPDLATVPDYKWPPMLAMPVPTFEPVVEAVPEQILIGTLPVVHRSDPPLRLRYCSLQI